MSLENKVNELIEKTFVFSDIHYPDHDIKALDVAEQVLKDWKPNRIVYIGDAYDATPVSHWLKDKKRKLENKRLLKDYEGVQKMLNRHAQLAGKQLKEVVYMLGNHEDWIREYIDCNPEVEGLIEIENHLKSPGKGIKFKMIPYIGRDRIFKVGKLYLIHGEYTNQYHASKTVNVYDRNIMYGHVHSVQEAGKVSPVDVEDRHMAVSIGSLCNKNPDYGEGKPNAWVHAFALVLTKDDKLFNHYVIRINDGVSIAPWGKVYRGKNESKHY
jgi:predicted phosphodiesterase